MRNEQIEVDKQARENTARVFNLDSDMIKSMKKQQVDNINKNGDTKCH